MKPFYHILVNVLISGVTTNFVWFALTFWAYLETQSVVATSIVAGVYLAVTAVSGFWFGSIVDHNKKKHAMLISSLLTIGMFLAGLLLYTIAPQNSFTSVASPYFWIFVSLLLFGVIAGNIRNIALPTVTTMLVPEKERDKANGMSGTVMGVSFAITSVGSGLVLARGGMEMVLWIAIGCTFLALLHLLFVTIPEKEIVHTGEAKQKIDIRGTIAAIRAVPGLLALLFFTTFNNFLGGLFMSLMDAYGLTLVSVEVWGFMLGFLSLGFIVGGLIVAKKGLGKKPLRTLFVANIIMWTTCIFFTMQPWILLLGSGMLIWMTLIPFVEAAEQTITQKVVPVERQGRVFGFSQSVESAASTLTAFFIGPIAQFLFIPFMTTGVGATAIGEWFGTGKGRGIALVFIIAGIIGLIVTIIAMRTKSYRLLSQKYAE